MIGNIVKLNKYGIEVERNSIGIAKDKIYGMSWTYKQIPKRIIFDFSVYIVYLNEESLIVVLPIDMPNKFFIYNELGEKLHCLTILDLVPNITGEIISLKIDINGKLLGFLTRYATEEFFIEFNTNTLEFGSVNKVRI